MDENSGKNLYQNYTEARMRPRMDENSGINKAWEIAKITIEGAVMGAFLGIWMGGFIGMLVGAVAIGLLALFVKAYDMSG
jgi:NO-binding membrane sensor protein with MHYT domain